MRSARCAHLHQTLAKVRDDIGRRRTFNTAIAAVMELMNALARFEDRQRARARGAQEALEIVVLAALRRSCRTPVMRFGTALGREPGAVIDARWPEPDPDALAQDVLEIVVQVNGKLRGRIHVPAPRTKRRSHRRR